ncbi:hypothetical protein D9615_005919 [Tricholomella constricta]|uniref:Uncharacterized protein n=1 Tax=Tricholomella constricta TaxID=117010 RepID=A0A8H5M3C3_9AGAR|nr:hypothetical protein D9615_005919 [Tricholomella constricta]
MPGRRSTLVARATAFKIDPDDVLQFATTAATLARDTRNISACAPAAAAAAVVLLILGTIQVSLVPISRVPSFRIYVESQNVKVSPESCLPPPGNSMRPNTIVKTNQEAYDGWESAPAMLIKDLEKFRETLWSIHHYMTLQADVNWRMRFAKKGSFEDALAELDALLVTRAKASRCRLLSTYTMSSVLRNTKVSKENALNETNTESEAPKEPWGGSGLRLFYPSAPTSDSRSKIIQNTIFTALSSLNRARPGAITFRNIDSRTSGRGPSSRLPRDLGGGKRVGGRYYRWKVCPG